MGVGEGDPVSVSVGEGVTDIGGVGDGRRLMKTTVASTPIPSPPSPIKPPWMTGLEICETLERDLLILGTNVFCRFIVRVFITCNASYADW